MFVFTLLAQFGNAGLQPANNKFLVDTSSPGRANMTALTNIEAFMSLLLGILTVLAGLFFVVNFVLGALQWVTAGGESGQINKARDKMVQGVIGLIIVIASYSVIGLIGTVLGLNILNPAEGLWLIVENARPA